jgi:hypothetical protein
MEISRPTAAGAHHQVARQVRLGSGSKGCGLFVSYGNPPDIISPADGIRDAIEGVTGHSVDSLDPGESQRFDE